MIAIFLPPAAPEGNRANHLARTICEPSWMEFRVPRVLPPLPLPSALPLPPSIVKTIECEKTAVSFRNRRREIDRRRKSTTRRRCYRFFFSADTVVICWFRCAILRTERSSCVKSVVLFLSPRVFPISLPWESTQIRKCNTTGCVSRAITHVCVRASHQCHVSVGYARYISASR